jgi:2-C-methyl-D-erythritol 4-phosphate cytidylyltransferase
MKSVSAIIVAAGRGKRFKHRISKPLAKIRGRPVILYSLMAFGRHPLVKEIILVANRENSQAIAKIAARYGCGKTVRVILGGRRRQDSVYNGLRETSALSKVILIHDAARPFVSRRLVSAVIRAAKKYGAAVPGVAVRGTIKKVEGRRRKAEGKCLVEKTLERENLREIQTPQAFCRELLLQAFAKLNRQEVTDEAMLVERMGVKVSIIPGDYRNIKITTPEDLIFAEVLAEKYAL